MAITFKDDEEYLNLNTQLQSMFDSGFHKSPGVYESFGGTDSLFKFHLGDDNPFDLNENYGTQNRSSKGDDWGNAIKYGWKGSLASSFELLASIPGGYDRFRDWAVETLGGVPNQENIADHIQDYFNALAKKNDPETLGLDAPSTYGTKVAAGFASLPLTVAQFIPAIRGLKAVGGLGKLGAGLAARHLPAGIAATEFLRNWDDANAVELAKATGYGYLLGKGIQIANAMNILPRMGMFGAMGFMTAGWDAPMEDRLAAATVFAGAGIFGPFAEGKSIQRSVTDAQLRYKQYTGDVPANKELHKSADTTQARILTNEALIKNHEKVLPKLQKIQEAVKNKKRYQPLKVEERNNLLSEKTYKDLQSKLKGDKEYLDAIYRAIYTTKEYSLKIIAGDRRSPAELKHELVNPDGTAKYQDLSSDFKISPFSKEPTGRAGVLLKPGKFVDQPLYKWGVDLVSRYMRKAEMETDTVLYDLKAVPEGHKTMFRGQKEGESFGDFVSRTGSVLDALGLIATSRRSYLMEKSYGGALTRYDAIRNRDPAKAKKIADVSFRIERDKLAESIKNEEKYTTEKEDGTFKYEVTEAELATKYKLDAESILAYKDIRGALNKVGVDYWNKSVERFGENKKSAKVEILPNYMPHVFNEQFTVWLTRKTADGKKEPIWGAGESNRFSADKVAKKLKELPEFKSDIYETQIVQRKRYAYGQLEEAAFFDPYHAMRIRGHEKELLALRDYFEKQRARGFKKFSKKRKWIEGFKGSEEYMLNRKFSKRFSPNATQAQHFADAIREYITGGIRSSNKMEANFIFNDALKTSEASYMKESTKLKPLAELYPNAAKYVTEYKDNALGAGKPMDVSRVVDSIGAKWIGESGLANLLGGFNQATLSLKLLFGNMRFIAAQSIQPYHMIFPKLVDLNTEGLNKGNIALTQLKSFKDLFFPDKEIKEAIKYFKEERLAEPKFLREFEGESQLLKDAKIEIGKDNFTIDFGKWAEVATLRKMSARVEQVSRLNAGVMFYNFLKSAGFTAEKAKPAARYLADKYMVEYNHYERPLIYGEGKMGTLGKPFGLFKTFQHNYLAHLTEHVATAKIRGNTAPLAAFLAQMIFAAGLYGTIAIETADALLAKLSPILEKFNDGQSIPSLKESIMTSSFPMWLKYGPPSAVTGIDFTATLAAPGQAVTDLVSVPALDTLGLTPWSWERGIVNNSFNALVVTFTSKSDLERKQAYVEFLKATAPTSLQFAIDQYYMGLPVGYDFFNSEILGLDLDAFEAYKEGPVRDPFKKGRGKYVREPKDWLARKMAAYSLDEQEATKLLYTATAIKRDLKESLETYVMTAAHHLRRDGYVPFYLYDMALTYGADPESFNEKIQNRIELMESDFLTRVMDQTNSLGHQSRIRTIRDLIDSQYLYQ